MSKCCYRITTRKTKTKCISVISVFVYTVILTLPAPIFHQFGRLLLLTKIKVYSVSTQNDSFLKQKKHVHNCEKQVLKERRKYQFCTREKLTKFKCHIYLKEYSLKHLRNAGGNEVYIFPFIIFSFSFCFQFLTVLLSLSPPVFPNNLNLVLQTFIISFWWSVRLFSNMYVIFFIAIEHNIGIWYGDLSDANIIDNFQVSKELIQWEMGKIYCRSERVWVFDKNLKMISQ